MSTSAPSRLRHAVADLPARAVEAMPDGAPRAFLAGVEAAVFGWLCVVVPAIATYVATAAAPALGEATWLQAAAVGTGVWLLAHGGAVAVAGAPVALVPLGLTLLAFAIQVSSSRRARLETWSGAAAAASGYAAVALLLLMAAPSGTGGPWGGVGGILAVGGCGALVGLRRGRGSWPPLAFWLRVQLSRVPAAARSLAGAGVRGAGVATALALGVGLAAVGVSLTANHVTLSAMLEALRADVFGIVMVLVAGVLLLPTAAVWAVAWLSGAGFAVGEATHVGPEAVSVGPLPAFPLVAAVPGPVALAAWTPVVLVAVGGAVGWYLHTRAPQRVWWASGLSAVVAGVGAGVLLWLLGLAASGPVGPGRMAQAGPDPLSLALSAAAPIALGALLVVLAARHETRTFARRRGRQAWEATAGALRGVPVPFRK